MSEREKTYVEDVNRSIYDIRNEEKDVYRIKVDLVYERSIAGCHDLAVYQNMGLVHMQIL